MLDDGDASARLNQTVGLIIPLVVLCLVGAAACAQPGRDKQCVRRLCERGDRATAACTLLIVSLMCVAFTLVGLRLVNAEVERIGELNSTEVSRAIEVKFCEGRYGGVFGGARSNPSGKFLPEWGSMCSAVFILYCGLHMLIFWVHDSAMLKLIATFFCVNGISSFFYHMTGLRRWLLADGNSMVLLVYMVVAYMYDELIETLLQQRLDAGAKRTARLMHALYWQTVCRRAVSAIIWMVCLMFAWYWIFGRVVSDAPSTASDTGWDVLVFGMPLVLILFFGIILAAMRHSARRYRRKQLRQQAQSEAQGEGPGPGQGQGQGQNHPLPVGRGRSSSADALSQFVQDRVMLGAGVRFALGLIAAILSASIWIATEALCDHDDAAGAFFRRFPGHMVWHIGMTWGLINCLVYAALLRADNFGQYPKFKSSPGCLGTLYFILLPGLIFLVPDDGARDACVLRRAPADAVESGSAGQGASSAAGGGSTGQGGVQGGLQGGVGWGGGSDGETAPMLTSEMERELHISNDDPLVVFCCGMGCRRLVYYLCCCFCCDPDGSYLDELLVLGAGVPKFAQNQQNSSCGAKVFGGPSVKVHMPLSFKSLRVPRMPSAKRSAAEGGPQSPPRSATRNTQAAARAARSAQNQKLPRPHVPRQLSDHV